MPERMRKALPWIALILIVCLAAQLRTFQIDTRPPHSDEGVNFLFTETTNRLGYYPFSHENYHGPLFFYIITGMVNAFGDDLLALRLGAILSGVLIVTLLIGFRTLASWTFVLVAATLVTVSPSQVFFARYAIHETLLVFGTLWFALSLLFWGRDHRPRELYALAISSAIMVATKETFTISMFSVGLAFLCLGDYRAHWTAIKAQAAHFFYAYLLFMVLVLAIYTGGFRWPDGIGEMALAFPQWLGRSSSDTGHFKPFLYYLKDVLWVTEPYLVVGVAAVILGTIDCELLRWLREENSDAPRTPTFRLSIFFAAWFLLTFLVYSIIKYKTVWLIINLSLPALLLIASGVTSLLEAPSKASKGFGAIALLALLFSAWNSMLRYNFVEVPLPFAHAAVENAQPYGTSNPFSYVHTGPGMLQVVQRVRDYWEKKPDARVLIGVEGYFPLPYYFHDKQGQCAYTSSENPDEGAKTYDIMLLDFYKQKWEAPGWSKEYFRLSDYAEINLMLKALPPESGTTAEQK